MRGSWHEGTTVDVQDLPRHVLASIATQEQQRGHDVFRLRNAAQGKRASTREQLLVGDTRGARHCRVDGTGRNRVDGDPIRAELACEAARESNDPGPEFSDFLVGSLRAATGRKMRFTGMTALRLENGKIAEEIGLDDGVTAHSSNSS